jgi:hypothetical protein
VQHTAEHGTLSHIQVLVAAGGLGIQDVGRKQQEAQLPARHRRQLQPLVCRRPHTVLNEALLIRQLLHLSRHHRHRRMAARGGGKTRDIICNDRLGVVTQDYVIKCFNYP